MSTTTIGQITAEQTVYNGNDLIEIETAGQTKKEKLSVIYNQAYNDAVAYFENNNVTWQYVQNHVILPYSYVVPATRSSAVELTCLNTSITTKRANTRIQIDYMISGEIYWDCSFILYRDIGGVLTEIGSPVSVGNHKYGIASPDHDPDYDSTMNQNTISYIDSPAAVLGTLITYRLKLYGTANTSYINRTSTDTDAAGYERGSSNVRLTEIK